MKYILVLLVVMISLSTCQQHDNRNIKKPNKFNVSDCIAVKYRLNSSYQLFYIDDIDNERYYVLTWVCLPMVRCLWISENITIPYDMDFLFEKITCPR